MIFKIASSVSIQYKSFDVENPYERDLCKTKNVDKTQRHFRKILLILLANLVHLFQAESYMNSLLRFSNSDMKTMIRITKKF